MPEPAFMHSFRIDDGFWTNTIDLRIFIGSKNRHQCEMTVVLWMTLTCILIDPNSSMYSIERGIPIVKNLFSFDLHFLLFLFLFLHVVDIIHKPLISTNCTPLLTNQISETNNQDFLYENYGLETIVSLKNILFCGQSFLCL